MVRLANAALGLLLAASSVAAELIYFDDPVDLWTTTLSGTELEYMNAVTMSPDDQLLYVTGKDGSMKALDPEDGSPVFSYKSPDINGYTLMGSSGVSFLIDVEEPSSYTIACAANLYNTLNPAEKKSSVYCLKKDGSLYMQSDPIDGTIEGTPQVTKNVAGEFLYFTRNTFANSLTEGHFTIIDVSDASIYMSYQEPTLKLPVAPLGIARRPGVEPFFGGWFGAGENNPNDVVVWSNKMAALESDPGSNGNTFAFQWPSIFGVEVSADTVIVLSENPVGWKTAVEPSFSNFGRNMYFTVSRSSARGWFYDGTNRQASLWDNRAPASASFTAANQPFRFLAPKTKLVPTPDSTRMVTGSAVNEIVALNADMTIDWTQVTASTIISDPLTSDQDTFYYFESIGRFVAANIETGAPKFTYDPQGDKITARATLNSLGTRVYFGDESGKITALVLASTPPTIAPTPKPSVAPTFSPTKLPTPTEAPITDSPVVATKVNPVISTDAPSQATSSASGYGYVGSIMLQIVAFAAAGIMLN